MIPVRTLIFEAETFAAVIPITTVVVEVGAVYIPTVVTPTFALVFNLKLFAIFNDYPRAIAIATASFKAVSITLTLLILMSV